MITRIALFLITAGMLSAGTVYTLDTTPLQTSSAGPFTLDFQFIDGSGTGDGNNTITLSDFDFGGGSVDTTPSFSSGGIDVTTGPLGVTLTDTSFFNDVEFSLTPGTSFSFMLDYTANSDDPAPDTFTFAIYDGSGNEIATTNPNGFDSFIELDLPSGGSGVNVTLSGSAPGASVTLNAPVPGGGGGGGSDTPEPSAFAPLALAAGLFVKHRVMQGRTK